MFKKLMLSLALLGGVAFGQASRYSNIVLGVTPNQLSTPLTAATIKVYQFPGDSTNCSGGGCTPATTYTDHTAGVSCGSSLPLTREGGTSCVGQVDAGANFGFWILPGRYQFCATAAGFGTTCTNISVGVDAASNNTFSGNNTYTGTNTFDNTVSVVQTGVFSSAQSFDQLISTLNGCSPAAMYSAQQAGLFAANAVSGCVAQPVGATNHQVDAVMGTVSTAADSRVGGNQGNIANAVGGYFSAQILANYAAGWGTNTVTDCGTQGNYTGQWCLGAEFDMNLPSGQTFGRVNGVLVTGLPIGSAIPATVLDSAVLVAFSGNKWPNAFASFRGSANIAYWAGALCSAGNCASQTLTFESFVSGVQHQDSIGVDPTGTMYVSVAGEGFGLSTSNGISLLCSTQQPTILSGFNTGTIAGSGSQANGSCAFMVNIGPGAGVSTGAVTLPTASHGWVCHAQNVTRNDYIQQTNYGTNSATFTNFGNTPGTPVNWTSADNIVISCMAF